MKPPANRSVQNLARLRAVFALAILALASTVAGQPCEDACQISLDQSHPHEVLREMADELGISIGLIGRPHPPVSASVAEDTVDSFVRRVAGAGGYLVNRVANTYTLYGADVEELTIVASLHHIAASTAVAELQKSQDGVDVFPIVESNAIALRGSSEEVRRALSLLDAIDHERLNVFMELLVVEYFHGDSFAWAYDIVNGEKGNVSDLSFIPGQGGLFGNYEVIADLPKSFRLNLSALVEDDEARVVTNPHVAVRSGEVGRLDFQEELNIVLTNVAGLSGTTRSLEKITAGVLLGVTPVVLGPDFVDLQVKGEVAVFVPSAADQFAVDRQTVDTQVLVEAGRTLIIGGLIKKEVVSSESGVPLLRRLPLLGNLFKSTVSAESYVETVIYVTPHINDGSAFEPGTIADDVNSQFDG